MKSFCLLSVAFGMAIVLLGATVSVERICGEIDWRCDLSGRLAAVAFCDSSRDEGELDSIEEVPAANAADVSPQSAVFFNEGFYSRRFEREEMFPLFREVPDENLDYKAFLFSDCMTPFAEPLTEDAFVCLAADVLSACTSSVSIDAYTEEISLERKGALLTFSATVSLGFECFSARYHLDWLPENTKLFIGMNLNVKKSEISVFYDSVSLQCLDFDLPETLLLFACELVFGDKDYRRLLGDSVKNLFVNAGIYR